MSNPYKQAGVDIDAGERLVKTIGPLAKSTARPGADGSLGGFGGLFDLKAAGFTDPVLVSGTDGVGTKLRLAFESGLHDTVGIDLVAMCANDILAQGATPLFFMDYFACGQLDEGVAQQVIAGIAEGCRQAGAALIGGETAEMPGMYPAGEYDLAGFCTGAAERNQLLPCHSGPRKMQTGDVMIGLASSGAHSNGYSLIRKIIAEQGRAWDDTAPFAADQTIAQAFLTPTRIYVQDILPLIQEDRIKGFAHITGGGLTDNVPRILPDGLIANYSASTTELPPLFAWLQQVGHIEMADMRRIFNCGIGAVVIVAPNEEQIVMDHLHQSGARPSLLGHLRQL